MKGAQNSRASTEALLSEYVTIGVQQEKALLEDAVGRYNRLYDERISIEAELRGRAGDARRSLLALYDHPNVQVRLNAAYGTLAVAPTEARRLLEAIAASKEYPQAGHAGMTIWALEEGIFKPI